MKVEHVRCRVNALANLFLGGSYAPGKERWFKLRRKKVDVGTQSDTTLESEPQHARKHERHSLGYE
jgi:hypothetical protein